MTSIATDILSERKGGTKSGYRIHSGAVAAAAAAAVVLDCRQV